MKQLSPNDEYYCSFCLQFRGPMEIVPLVLSSLLIVFSILIKHYVHRTARRSTKKLQRGIFDRLLRTSSTSVNESLGVSSLNAMLESNLGGNIFFTLPIGFLFLLFFFFVFTAFSVRANTITSCMLVFFSMLFLMFINGFWSLLSLLMVVEVVALYFTFR